MTFDPVNTRVYWTYWYSVKDTDGRRNSRKNKSHWHAFTDKNSIYAICGQTMWIGSREWTEVPRLTEVCSKCFGMVK